jgi:hypothetical protein
MGSKSSLDCSGAYNDSKSFKIPLILFISCCFCNNSSTRVPLVWISSVFCGVSIVGISDSSIALDGLNGAWGGAPKIPSFNGSDPVLSYCGLADGVKRLCSPSSEVSY